MLQKESYFKDQLYQNSKNLKQKWDTIRAIVNRKKVTSQSYPIPDKVLGSHYSTIAQKLSANLEHITTDDIPSSSKYFRATPFKNSNTKEFAFRTITEREVYEGLLKLDSSKGPGIDNLDIKTIKLIADIISPHLTNLFNQSIEESVYPEIFKTARCVPVYKGYQLDPEQPVNYRPISILCCINKTLERLLYDQLYLYLDNSKLIPHFQYGYRKHHNTSQAVLDLTNHIIKNKNKKEVSIAIFMDLSKAFDTVDKSILDYKLDNLGVTKTSKDLITNYMTNRKFVLKDNKNIYSLDYGVPQGSILGPLLFITYIYDMTNITTNDKIIVYADDTTVVVSGRNLTEAKQRCNDILTRFYQYFTHNKLSINSTKTKYMIFKPNVRSSNNKKKLFDTTNTNIIMQNTILEEVNSIRFLGVIINNKLTWELHKQHVHAKISKTIGIIHKCKYIMKENDVMNMYKTFIEPYFLYAIEVWGHSITSNSDILIKLQNRVIRNIFNCWRTEDAWKICNDRITNIKDLYVKVIKRICHKHHCNQLPEYFSLNIMPIKTSTDQSCLDKFQNIPQTRTASHKLYNYKIDHSDHSYTFKYNCANIWNNLPLEVKQIPYSYCI